MIRVDRTSPAAIPHPEAPHEGLLVSFNLATNNPTNFADLCANLAETSADPSCLEILAAVDDGDQVMINCIARESASRPFNIKHLIIPRAGYFQLWHSLNRLHQLCDPSAYFVSNINDEIRFKTPHWDSTLRRYIDLFPDRLFRLRTSMFKNRAYYDFWENGYAPENYAFYTKRWIDLQGDWNACHGPDAFQQFVAYYLMRGTFPASQQHNRDVAVWDIAIEGEGVSLGLTPDQVEARVKPGWQAWYRLVSHAMQEEALRRARRLQLYIEALAAGHRDFTLVDDPDVKQVAAVEPDGNGILRDLRSLPLAYRYNLSWLRIQGTAWLRRPLEYYYCGGGRAELMPALTFLPFRYLPFLYPIVGHRRNLLRGALEMTTWLRWETRRAVVRAGRVAFAPLRSAFESLARKGRNLHSQFVAPGLAKFSRRMMYDRFGGSPYDLEWRYARASRDERAGVPGATNSAPGLPPSRLNDGTPDPWGSAETADDTVFWLSRAQPFGPHALRVVLFSPDGRAHLRDVSVVAGEVSCGAADNWDVLPSRIGDGAWGTKLEVLAAPDFSTVVFEIDPGALAGKSYNAFGLACFSSSSGYRRNHLAEGSGIYVRELALSERSCAAGSQRTGSPVLYS